MNTNKPQTKHKIVAVFLVITVPIWFPIGLIVYGIRKLYDDLLEGIS